MIDVKIRGVFNIEGALQGMRNPLKSWDKADSGFVDIGGIKRFEIGYNDLRLARKLVKSGSDHRKFLRQIFVCMDIKAPLYWFKQFDTYKVGTTANSESTMHTITKKPLTINDFSIRNLSLYGTENGNTFIRIIELLNYYREQYLKEESNKDKQKDYWYNIIELLPSNFNQTRTVTVTFENLLNMYKSRKSHKLDEWKDFCKGIENIPYFTLICLK